MSRAAADLLEFRRPRIVAPPLVGSPMEDLIAIDKERLVLKHQEQMRRLHEGIRARALDHAAALREWERHASELGDAIRSLQKENSRLRAREAWTTIIAVGVVVFAVWVMG